MMKIGSHKPIQVLKENWHFLGTDEEFRLLANNQGSGCSDKRRLHGLCGRGAPAISLMCEHYKKSH